MHVRIEREHQLAVAREPLVRVLSDVPAVIACIPGAAVTAERGDGTYDAEIGAHYGEMAALFHGRITVGGGAAEAFTARLEGRDAHTGITADGSVMLVVRESSPSGIVLRVSVDLSFGGVLAPLGAAAARVSVPLLLESFARCLGAKATARVDAVTAPAESLSGPARRDGDERL